MWTGSTDWTPGVEPVPSFQKAMTFDNIHKTTSQNGREPFPPSVDQRDGTQVDQVTGVNIYLRNREYGSTVPSTGILPVSTINPIIKFTNSRTVGGKWSKNSVGRDEGPADFPLGKRLRAFFRSTTEGDVIRLSKTPAGAGRGA